jgi:hypothetical protein
MSSWTIKRGDATAGPFSTERVKSLIKAGKIRGDDLLSCDNGITWHTLASLAKQDSPQDSSTPAIAVARTRVPESTGNHSEQRVEQGYKFRYELSSGFSVVGLIFSTVGLMFFGKMAIDGTHLVKVVGLALPLIASRGILTLGALFSLVATLFYAYSVGMRLLGVRRFLVASAEGLSIPRQIGGKSRFYPWASMSVCQLVMVNKAWNQLELRFLSKSLKPLCAVTNKAFASPEEFQEFVAIAHAFLKQKMPSGD